MKEEAMKLRIKQKCNVRHATWKVIIELFDPSWRWGLLGLLGVLGLLGLGTAQVQVTPSTPITNLGTTDSRTNDTAANTIVQGLPVQDSPADSDQISSQALLVPPLCDIQLNKTSYVNGDEVIAQVLRVANPTITSLAIEFKLWFDVPTISPISFARGGANGKTVLSAGFDQNFGPLTLVIVQPTFPRGTYVFNCRMLHPVTKELFTEDSQPFTIQ